MKLQEVIDELDRYRDANWFTPYRLQEEYPQPQKINEVSEKLDLFLYDSLSRILGIFHASIFEGEIIDLENVKDTTKRISETLQSIPALDLPNFYEEQMLSLSFESRFRDPLNKVIKLYLHIAVIEHQKIDNFDGDLIFNKDEDDIYSGLIQNFSVDPISDLLRLFALHIQICEFDFSVISSDDQRGNLYNLVKIYHYIDRISVQDKDLVDLVKEKCAFLINKLIIRFQRESNVPLYNVIGGAFRQFRIIDYNNRFYINNRDYIDSHYKLTTEIDWKRSLGKTVSKNYKNYEGLRISEIVRSIRYYLKVEPDISELFLIRDIILKKYKECATSKPFDKRSLGVCLNYVSNCALSLATRVMRGANKVDQVSSTYSIVIDTQKITSIKNFYPHKVYSDFLISEIEQLSEDMENDNLKRVEDLIQRTKDVLSRYKDCIEWSKRNLTYVVQLPFDECFFSTGIPAYPKVFLASSYFVPLHENQIITDIDAIMSGFERAQSKYFIARDRKAVKNIIETFGRAEVRSMEILAMFSALVAFVIGSVNITGRVQTAYEAALFSSSLAASLGLFVFMILGIHRGGIEKIKHHWWLIILVALLIIIFFGLLLVYDDKGLTLMDIVNLITQ